MKRRILLIVIILLIVGLIGGVLWLNHRRNQGPRLLRRARVAISAQEYDRALDLAKRYTQKYPRSWRGYYMQAEIYDHLGKFQEARELLERLLDESNGFKPNRMAVLGLLAETYASPAKQALSLPEPSKVIIDRSISQLNQANRLLTQALGEIEDKSSESFLKLSQAVGVNLLELARAHRMRADAARLEAERAEAAGLEDLYAQQQAARQEAEQLAETAELKATEQLLAVVLQAPSETVAARKLVDLCIRRNDRATLKTARQAIMSLENPPALAAVALILDDLRHAEAAEDPRIPRQRLAEASRQLEALLDQPDLRPEETLEIQLTRIHLGLEQAVRAGRREKAEHVKKALALCEKVLADYPRHPAARLMKGKLLIMAGRFEEAEQLLFALKTDNPTWLEAHFAYAGAAERVGRTALMHEAMQTVASLPPQTDYERRLNAVARGYLSRALLEEGLPERALNHAEDYYAAYPNDPGALEVYVEAAWQADRRQLAAETLAEAVANNKPGQEGKAGDPIMLMAASEGYARIGRPAEALQAARLAARCQTSRTEQLLAVARALQTIGQLSQAEQRLLKAIEARPNEPALHMALGDLYRNSERVLQALEQYELAAKLDEANEDYQLAIARTLYNIGNIDEAEAALAQIPPGNAQARMLQMQIDLIRGRSTEEIAQAAMQGGRAGLALAAFYLQSGQVEKCRDVCLKQLEKPGPTEEVARVLLGQAYAALNEPTKAQEQWSAALQNAPEKMPHYLRLAGLLGRKLAPDDVAAALLAIPNAKKYLVDLTEAWLNLRLRRPGPAANIAARIEANPDVPGHIRAEATLLKAQALGRAGKVDEAVASLEGLLDSGFWKYQALFQKAALLAGQGRKEAAEATLAHWRRLASEQHSAKRLRQVAQFYARIGSIESALDVSDELLELDPGDAMPCLLRARIYEAARRPREAVQWYEKAILLQPTNLRVYLRVARLLDSLQDAAGALDVLSRLERLGQTGRLVSCAERGEMFVRWGLTDKAAEEFQKAAEAGTAESPKLNLALGTVLLRLGQKARARQTLEKIPSYSPQYLSAQLLLAGLAETQEQHLLALQALTRAHPGAARVLIEYMATLLRAGRPAEAVSAYENFAAQAQEPLPARLHELALRAMFQAEQWDAASTLARQQAQRSGSDLWRRRAILLTVENDLQAAADMLGDPSAADLRLAVLGVIVGAKAGNEADLQRWARRVDELEEAMTQASRATPMPAGDKLLVLLTAGMVDRARRQAEAFDEAQGVHGMILRDMSRSLLAGPDAPVLAAELLRASMSQQAGMMALARRITRQLLAQAPASQWAGYLLLRMQPTQEDHQRLLEVLEPSDCLLAKLVKASLLSRQGRFNEAAKIYAEQLPLTGQDTELLFNEAASAEQAGKVHKALGLYQQLWEKSRNVLAANNAAYVMTQLWPEDQEKLREARTLAEAAVKAVPGHPNYNDTLGWVAHLQHDQPTAIQHLRLAIKGLPDSPDVHYHLGLAEAAAGHTDLARWHLEAAIALAPPVQPQTQPASGPAAAAPSVAKLAREALEKLIEP